MQILKRVKFESFEVRCTLTAGPEDDGEHHAQPVHRDGTQRGEEGQLLRTSQVPPQQLQRHRLFLQEAISLRHLEKQDGRCQPRVDIWVTKVFHGHAVLEEHPERPA